MEDENKSISSNQSKTNLFSVYQITPKLFILMVVVFVVGGIIGYMLGINQIKPSTQNLNLNTVVLPSNYLNFTSSKPDIKPTEKSIIKPTDIPDSAKTSYKSLELGINFDYPAKIGLAHENPASKGKGGSSLANEEWWRIDFDKTGFDAGYFEVSASTPNYTPSSWEGNKHWVNIKISSNEPEQSVLQKLKEAIPSIISVKKVVSASNISGFRAYALNCYGSCSLESFYIVPLSNAKYNNLLILTVLKDFSSPPDNRSGNPATWQQENEQYNLAVNQYLENTKNNAPSEIAEIESGQSDPESVKYSEWQEMIFNSLKFVSN